MERPILNFRDQDESTLKAKKDFSKIKKNTDITNSKNAHKRHEKILISQQKQHFLQEKTKDPIQLVQVEQPAYQLKTKRKYIQQVDSYDEYILLQKQQEEYIYKQQKQYTLENQELNECIIYTCEQHKQYVKKKDEYKVQHMGYIEQLKEQEHDMHKKYNQYSLEKQEFKKCIKNTWEQYKQNKNKDEYNKDEYNKKITEYIDQLKELHLNIHVQYKQFTLQQQESIEFIKKTHGQYLQCKKQIEEYIQQYKKYIQELKELEDQKMRLNFLHIKQTTELNNLYLNKTNKNKYKIFHIF